MFTNTKCSIYAGQDKVYTESVCLSTDTKPTTGIANGSVCIEMNTGKKFMFDEASGELVEVPSSGGGGGGGSDFSTAEVTVNGSGYIMAAFIQNNDCTIGAFSLENETMPIILFKGKADLYTEDTVSAISGDIELDVGSGDYIVTGDCTITIS